MTRLARNIRTTGSIMPSSKFLISRLLRPIDFSSVTSIVELGAGTGVITRGILSRMSPDCRLMCVERDVEFVRQCAAIGDPRLSVHHACATDLPRVLADAGTPAVDCVVSSLPLSLLEDSVADRILEVAQASLRPGGKFLQFQYSLTYRRRLRARYDDVRVGFALRNVPPAVIYECMMIIPALTS